jgi:hypothetical protein
MVFVVMEWDTAGSVRFSLWVNIGWGEIVGVDVVRCFGGYDRVSILFGGDSDADDYDLIYS